MAKIISLYPDNPKKPKPLMLPRGANPNEIHPTNCRVAASIDIRLRNTIVQTMHDSLAATQTQPMPEDPNLTPPKPKHQKIFRLGRIRVTVQYSPFHI